MPLLQTNLEGDYLPQCFHCTSDKPGSLLLLSFSEILPSLFTPVSSSLPVLMLLCFNSQSALDLKSDWPELLPSSVMRKREELWGRDCIGSGKLYAAVAKIWLFESQGACSSQPNKYGGAG